MILKTKPEKPRDKCRSRYWTLKNRKLNWLNKKIAYKATHIKNII